MNYAKMDGWNGPSIGGMPAAATENLLPRQFFVLIDVADGSSPTPSPSDVSIIQPAHECTASGLHV